MGMNRKDLVGMLGSNLAMLKSLAQSTKNTVLLKQVEEQEKKLNEAIGERKPLTCDGCRVTKVLTLKQYEDTKAHWFTCPHGSIFCPKCLRKTANEAREKRKAEKATKADKKEAKK